MRIIFLTAILISVFLNTENSSSQNLNSDEKDILTLQDKRTLGENGKLLNYLNSTDNKVRFMTLYALANISDTVSVSSTLPFIEKLIDGDFSAELLNEFAFYLGQTPSFESNKLLNDMIDSPEPILVPSYPEIINSIGKTGDEKELNNMISVISKRTYSESDALKINRALALSIGRFALRKINNEKSVDALRQLANIKDTIVQRNTAFAFWRTADKNLLEPAKQEIYDLAESEDAQTRMWAFNAMGKLQDEMLLMYTLESFGSEKDWRVKINMLNSILNFEPDSLKDFTEQVFSMLNMGTRDANELVSLTALTVMGNYFKDIQKSNNVTEGSLSEVLKKSFTYSIDSAKNISWRQRSALANSMSLIFRDECKDALINSYKNTDSYDLKSGILSAFGNFENGEIYKEVREMVSEDVQNYNKVSPNIEGAMIGSEELAKLYRGFVDMLTMLDNKVGAEDQNIIRLIYTEFAGSKDLLITAVCLDALQDSLYLKYRDETASVILFDYNDLKSPMDDELKLIYIDAMKELNNEDTKNILKENLLSDNYEIAKLSAEVLEKIDGTKYDFTAKPRYDFDWNYMEGMSQKTIVTVQTNKGNIKIELLPEVAPFTVMNFLKLSENNYYDGTIFHRVVPNFVIQGGDPTGTGYGGPGYSIRGEYSPLTYETGMVGMASSGKDTEGSQFFITHSATPHLDGRYTIFGKVLSGMDVVDQIMVGDYIEELVISN